MASPFASGFRKFLAASVLASAWVATASAGYVVKQLTVASGTGGSFSTSANVANTGQYLVIRPFVVADVSSARPGRVTVSGLPSGLVFDSISSTDSDCAPLMVTSTGNTSFSYEFPNDCDATVQAVYRTVGAATGSTIVSAMIRDSGVDGILDTGDDPSLTTTNNATITIDGRAVLTHALSLDSDADGYLDGYLLTFNLPLLSTLPLPGTRVTLDGTGATGLSFSWPGSNTGTLSFDDGVFGGDKTPRIEIDGNADYATGSYFAGVVADGAAPVVTSSHATGTTYTGALSVTLSATESATVRYSTG